VIKWIILWRFLVDRLMKDAPESKDIDGGAESEGGGGCGLSCVVAVA
jgi:hypothetical protein